jgi:hypothetical protein
MRSQELQELQEFRSCRMGRTPSRLLMAIYPESHEQEFE